MYKHSPPMTPPAMSEREELINNIWNSIDESQNLLYSVTEEEKQVMSIVEDARHIRFNLKDELSENYNTKISNLREDIRLMKERIAFLKGEE